MSLVRYNVCNIAHELLRYWQGLKISRPLRHYLQTNGYHQ